MPSAEKSFDPRDLKAHTRHMIGLAKIGEIGGCGSTALGNLR